MKRAVLYTRYSDEELQNEASCVDQERECRVWANARGYDVVKVYSDPGISGESIVNRPDMLKLLQDAQQRRFDAVIAESSDRLSRDMEGMAHIKKQLTFRQIELLTIIEGGQLTSLQIAFKSAMNAQELENIGHRVRRAGRGLTEKGKAPGGKSYGYVVRRIDEAGALVTGERTINEDEASIVRRIFAEYLSGMSPRKIAAGLNAEGIPSPRGGQWNASTVGGHRARRTGILQNPLYVGRILYGRSKFLKDPNTAKRVSRLTDESEWTTGNAPQLRIIDDETWEAAQALRRATTHKGGPHLSRRPKHFLSGLLRCSCGGPMIMVGPEYFGCSWHRERGASICPNGRRIPRIRVEEQTLEYLAAYVLAPERWKVAAEDYRADAAEWNRTAGQRVAELQRKRDRLDAQCEGVVKAIKEGYATKRMKDDMMDAERQIEELDREIAVAEKPKVVSLHPNAVEECYKEWVRILNSLRAGERPESADRIRWLIEQVEAEPLSAKRGGEVKITMTYRLPDMGTIVLALPEAQKRAVGATMTMTKSSPRNHRHFIRDTQTPRARNGLGVLHAPRAAEMQDAREIAGKLQVNARRILARHHLDLGDHGADQIHRLAAKLGIDQQLLQARHPPPGAGRARQGSGGSSRAAVSQRLPRLSAAPDAWLPAAASDRSC